MNVATNDTGTTVSVGINSPATGQGSSDAGVTPGKDAGVKKTNKAGSDGGIKDAGTTDSGIKDAGIKNIGCASNPATESKSNGNFSDPDYDAANSANTITLAGWKVIAAKFDDNKTPANPGLAGFAITPEYFDTEANRQKRIAHYGGDEENVLGRGAGKFSPDPGNLDFSRTMPERPDLNPDKLGDTRVGHTLLGGRPVNK